MSDLHYNLKTKKSKKIYRAAQIFAVIFTLTLCIMFISAMCASPPKSGELVWEKREYYAVSMGTFESHEPAITFAAGVKNRNGAGFVANDRGFRVLAAAYPTKRECESVLKKLSAAGQQCSLYKIEIPRTYISAGSLSQKELTRALESLLSASEKLYSLSLSLDTLKVMPEAARIKIKEISDGISPNLSCGGIVCIRLRAELTAQKSALAELAESGFEGILLSAGVKHAQIRLLFDIKALLGELKD